MNNLLKIHDRAMDTYYNLLRKIMRGDGSRTISPTYLINMDILRFLFMPIDGKLVDDSWYRDQRIELFPNLAFTSNIHLAFHLLRYLAFISAETDEERKTTDWD